MQEDLLVGRRCIVEDIIVSLDETLTELAKLHIFREI
jgi:hypothetical protein